MKVEGEYTFDAPQDIVWEAVQDPNVLGMVVPGGQGFEEVGENEYEGKLKVKVGPVNGTFKAHMVLSDITPPNSYSVVIDGKGAPGHIKGDGSLELEGQGDKTLMKYVGDATVGGRLASVGQRLIDTSAKSIIRQSLESLNEYLKIEVQKAAAAAPPPPPAEEAAPAAAAEGGAPAAVAEAPAPAAGPATEPVPEFKPPSQTQLALNVARDVFNDMVPAQAQPFVIGGVAVIIIAILWLLFT